MSSWPAKGSGLEDLNSLADPRLKKLKIGVNMYTSDAENSPPAMALSRYGVVGNLKGYFTFFSDQDRPEDIIKGVANKDVDIAIAWGPLAGYYAKQSPVPLVLTPLPDTGLTEQYALPVQHRASPSGGSDKEFRDSLQTLLDRKAPEIRRCSRIRRSRVPRPGRRGKGADKASRDAPSACGTRTRAAKRTPALDAGHVSDDSVSDSSSAKGP